MKEKFLHYVLHKKYHAHEFVEPVVALPFAYALLRMLEGQFNTLTMVLLFVLVLIYLPAIIVFVQTTRP